MHLRPVVRVDVKLVSPGDLLGRRVMSERAPGWRMVVLLSREVPSPERPAVVRRALVDRYKRWCGNDTEAAARPLTSTQPMARVSRAER